MWQQEYEKRKKDKVKPKQEWTCINFVQEYIKQHPNASKNVIQYAWKQEQQKHIAFIKTILKEI